MVNVSNDILKKLLQKMINSLVQKYEIIYLAFMFQTRKYLLYPNGCASRRFPISSLTFNLMGFLKLLTHKIYLLKIAILSIFSYLFI